MAGRISRGDIRLYRFAPPDKERPVLVLTRDALLPHLTSVTIASITSTTRGAESEILLGPEDGMKQVCAVNLHSVITVRKDRLGRRVAALGEERMQRVCAALSFALGCDH